MERFADFDQHSQHYRVHGLEDYETMRSECPIPWSSSYGGFWVLSRYEDVAEAARQPDIFSSALDLEKDPLFRGVMIPARYSNRHSLLEMDGQDWRDIRRVLAPWFSPPVLERASAHISDICDSQLDQFIESGRMDLVLDYAVAVPAIVALELIGLPEEVEHFRTYADPHHEVVYRRPDSPGFEDVLAQIDAVHRRIAIVIERRREEPRDDLLTALTRASFRGELMSDELVLEVMSQLLSGGFDTTTALIGNAVVYLNEHPDVAGRLIEEPALIPTAVDEFLRFFSPSQGTGRNVTCDTDLNGHKLKRGDRVLMAWASANRDPAVFENPTEIKLDRSPNRHCAFGLGIHRCLGAGLGKLESQLMLSKLLERIPEFRVAMDEAEPYELTGQINGWKKVPATFPPGRRKSHSST